MATKAPAPATRTPRRAFLAAAARVTFLTSLCATVGATIISACGGGEGGNPNPDAHACDGGGYGYNGCGYGY